jgi:hypothetical protein
MAEICCPSLDEAWLQAVQAACSSRGHEVSPLVVAFDVTEDHPMQQYRELRSALDSALIASGRATVGTVANTLFPYSLWNPSRPREHLFQRYLKILPALRHDVRNRRGLYFERLISYPGTRGTAGKNQLNHIAETYISGNHRRSALQAAVFYPSSDLSNARQLGFPCLQQVAFLHNQARGTLTITGFYAMQYLFERAYGNYLGLARLGEFMAHEMNLELERVVCIAAVAKLDVSTSEVQPLLSRFLAQTGREKGLARV